LTVGYGCGICHSAHVAGVNDCVFLNQI